jgi:hypothetical protein
MSKVKAWKQSTRLRYIWSKVGQKIAHLAPNFLNVLEYKLYFKILFNNLRFCGELIF